MKWRPFVILNFQMYKTKLLRFVAEMLQFLDIAIAAILNFQKFDILTVFLLYGGQYAPPCQISSKIGQTVAQIWRFNTFQIGDRPPSWICWAQIWTTHKEHLVVSIALQNLVGINAVVVVIYNS